MDKIETGEVFTISDEEFDKVSVAFDEIMEDE